MAANHARRVTLGWPVRARRDEQEPPWDRSSPENRMQCDFREMFQRLPLSGRGVLAWADLFR